MTEHYYAASYWFARAESADECAHRAETFFRGLANCDPSFTRWFEKASSFKKARQLEFEPTAETFRAFFARKKYKGVGGGFMLGVWNGQTGDEGCGVSLSCGSPSNQIPNSCVLSLPPTGPFTQRVLTARALTALLRCMVLAWDPDWSEATSDEFLELVKPRTDNVAVSWLMYLSHRWGTIPALPEPVRVEPIEDKGTLILLAPEPLTATNPAHVELAKQVRERLDQARLLRRSLV